MPRLYESPALVQAPSMFVIELIYKAELTQIDAHMMCPSDDLGEAVVPQIVLGSSQGPFLSARRSAGQKRA